MAKDAKTIREELARPFAPEDLEWRIQVMSKDKTSGLAIPYVTNRAIQDRLDEVVGLENWYNDYKPWHGNGKKDAQICGISIYFEDKGFITKWDGAEDSDIEPIKGGLSDAMKRAAVQWGIGRVLYKMTKPLWVKIEQKGNSYVICDTERPKLNAAYLELLDRLTAQIQELQSEIASLEAQRFENVNLEDLQEQLVQVSEQYEELSGEAPETPDTAELDAKLQEFHAKLGARSSEVYQPKYTGPLAEDTAKVQALGKKYQQNAALLKRFQPGTSCPVCRRVLSQQEYPAFRQALQAETEKIAADGTQLKGQIAELQELEQKSQSTFEQFKADDLVRYQSEIDALNQKREQLQAAAAQQNIQRQQTLEQLRARIQNLTASMECGTLSPADSERLAECKASLEDCRVQLAAAQQVLSAAPEDFDTRIKAIEEEITEKKIIMKDVILYMSKRAEMTFSKLALNRVKISLYDVVKTTGELKDVFRFTYNGRRYDRLSLSEKIRAGAEVSELVKRLTGRNYPVFFDNMESVDDLSNIRPTSQMILAKCIRNAELSVRAGGTAMPKAA